MPIIERFRSALVLAGRDPVLQGEVHQASRLSWAAAQVLGAQGAGITAMAQSRLVLALGSSSESAAVAERWQFSAGEGPDGDSLAGSTVLTATHAVMTRSWPVFTGHLLQHTDFRSLAVVHVPQVGALVVYFDDPVGCLQLDVGHARLVARSVGGVLAASEPLGADCWPGWDRPAVQLRSQVWTAVGMLVEHLQMTPPDALAVLRAGAFARDRCVDHLAHDLVCGVLAVHQFDV
ncbi:ANTAR domain-containing protein [Nakamurella flavida]|uniref:ANTAR domain-containing protein n=1 Tax=Nakamurella flavida TaxID=363630 RepID=A0A938YMV4_9ACTN|nr:ANTAR domain-containing protein [Nakamurella flavida]MBM9475795.1 ANTAR domain-containing protein [Nakamurella flavida]MDP9777923.1 hypothetical protein [Nakamurella flavida]